MLFKRNNTIHGDDSARTVLTMLSITHSRVVAFFPVVFCSGAYSASYLYAKSPLHWLLPFEISVSAPAHPEGLS